MSDLAPFCDIETAVMQTVNGLGTADTATPPDLSAHLPFIRVNRIGGPDTRFIDTARVDIDCFAADRPTAYALAESVRQRMLNVPHVVAAGRIDSVVTDSGPREIPWGDPALRRFTASYTVTSRR